MQTRSVFLILFFCCFSCSNENAGTGKQATALDSIFTHEKWMATDGQDYTYRDQIYRDVLYNDTIRSLGKAELLDLLGEPDRTNEDYLYYTIDQKRLGLWPLHTRTMVFKLTEHDSIEWIKLHE